jgi:hypothetical protein
MPDVDDDHYYRGSGEMAAKANDYDSRARNGQRCSWVYYCCTEVFNASAFIRA